MTGLDANTVREFTGDQALEKLERLQVFTEIASTNTFLMQQPAPASGQFSVAVTDNQTAGRGRHGKTWESPPGAGLCLSIAYTFAQRPENYSALTLAVGLAAIAALEELGVGNVQLKWPNDLVADDSKLAGILTEVQAQSAESMTIVTGIGLNVDMPASVKQATQNDWAKAVVDLKSLSASVPALEQIAGVLITHVQDAFGRFEAHGFGPFATHWTGRDWLLGRDLCVESADRAVVGVGVGIAEDGALLIDTQASGVQRITSGSVTLAERVEQAL